ncbi:MAG TPA: tetratricopeptide repeat protein [Thermoanaerobaculia bacterium]
MKRMLPAVFVLAVAPTLLASGAGSMPSMPQQQRSPHDQAVDYYNNGERRLEKLTKMHDEMKAATDPQRAAKMQQNITKGLESAANDFERATNYDPRLYQAYSELGFTLRKLGKYNDSLAAYDHALQLQPDFAPALEYRAEAYLGLNQLDEVKSAYMTLFSGDRQRADILMTSMKSWIAERRTTAGGIDAQKLDDFAKWVEQRATIAGQTSSLNSQISSFRSW